MPKSHTKLPKKVPFNFWTPPHHILMGVPPWDLMQLQMMPGQHDGVVRVFTVLTVTIITT